jgi:hypothetical protein
MSQTNSDFIPVYTEPYDDGEKSFIRINDIIEIRMPITDKIFLLVTTNNKKFYIQKGSYVWDVILKLLPTGVVPFNKYPHKHPE